MMGELSREAFGLLAASDPRGVGTLSGWLKDLFDIGNGTFWVAIATIAFVALVIWKGRGMIVGSLDSRAARIRQDIEEAARLREEARALLAEYQKKQREAMGEAEAMVRQAEDEAKRLRARAEADLSASLKRREQQALDRIAQAEAQAVAEVRNLAADLAIAATQKLLTERLDPAKAEGLVSDAIADLPRRLQ